MYALVMSRVWRVILPSWSAPAPVISLYVEPGGLCSWMARLMSGRSSRLTQLPELRCAEMPLAIRLLS